MMDVKRLYDAELAGACRKAQAQHARRSVSSTCDDEAAHRRYLERITVRADSTVDDDQRDLVREVVNALWPAWSPTQRAIYKLRFVAGWPMGSVEVADAISRSKRHVNIITSSILTQIKEAVTSR